MEFVTYEKSSFERILMTLDRLNDAFTEGGEIISKTLVPNTFYILDYSLLQELKDSFMHASFFLSHDDAFIADTLADR